MTDLVGKLQAGLAGLDTATGHHGGDGVLAEAKHFCTACCRRCSRCARPPTRSRRVVDDDLWPLPTYQEILFIK